MPYIKQEQRDRLNSIVSQFCEADCFGPILSAGDMNYLFSKMLHIWIGHKGLCYATLNEATGVLECCKQELYRQVAAPYEDKKKQENGAVSNLDSPE